MWLTGLPELAMALTSALLGGQLNGHKPFLI
ncbi:hypothetical protein HYPGJ_21140 [Hyphomicrobium sp. GJ21]|nr:hypothetical protein HYPGJ_21140 [Hyphomicrobium sp. GJ21]